ncbi:Uncharacterised protein [Vibrio cholerae]|nr:Uncharacterised protein [Vibrio cholerae]CSB21275.1 Uncharacterised protein [Vibrio cholerae]CSC28751.1 Uncharacterised protein [Vibrio cholerae]CSC32733.1 Uncharacterised protein [Vibrio cholerae]CSC42447.1 Uncharacterised protein [Vibrio cholerae]
MKNKKRKPTLPSKTHSVMSHIQMNIFFLIEAVVMLATSRLQGNKPYYDLALLARTSG